MQKLKDWFAGLPRAVRLMLGAFVAIVIAMMLAKAALAEDQPPVCKPHDEAAAILAQQYGEARVSVGILGNGQSMMEMFANPASGTWTVLMTSAQGIACIVAYGESFEAVTEAAPKPGTEG